MMDFGALPPEINSGRMYAGAGAAPMMAAAGAWNGLAAELSTTAASYQSAIATLTGEEWLGPASSSMAAAVGPYVAWLNTTAAAAEQAAAQASASAAAFEAAFAMTVPPPVVAANRTQFATLVATNILGINTAAIAATEAHYAQMWAQDAIAMYGYAAASASAGALQPLNPPTPTTNPAGLANQAAAAGSAQSELSQLVSGLPNTVQTLASPLSAAAGPAQAGDFLSDFIGSTQNIGIWNAIQTYSTYAVTAGSWHLFAGMASAIAIASPGVEGAAGVTLMDAVDTPAGAAPAGPAVAGSTAAGRMPVLAGMAQAAPVGGLSVPSSWPGALPTATGTAPLITSEWIPDAVAETPPMAAVPAGMGAAAAAGRGGLGLSKPHYGVKPTVMTRPVAAG